MGPQYLQSGRSPRAIADNGEVTDRSSWHRERQEMVAFAVRWAPFGGGSAEDIWIRFGVSERVYFLRLRVLLQGPAPQGLDEMMWTRLRRVCDQRLAGPDDPGAPPPRQVTA